MKYGRILLVIHKITSPVFVPIVSNIRDYGRHFPLKYIAAYNRFESENILGSLPLACDQAVLFLKGRRKKDNA